MSDRRGEVFATLSELGAFRVTRDLRKLGRSVGTIGERLDRRNGLIAEAATLLDWQPTGCPEGRA